MSRVYRGYRHWTHVAESLGHEWRTVMECSEESGSYSYPWRRLKELGCEVRLRQENFWVRLQARKP